MNITYYGHSCFSVSVNGKTIFIDPFIKPNELAAGVDFDGLLGHYILVSHAHEDHIADLVELAKNTGAQVISNFEIVTWAEKQGITNVHPMNIGGSCEFEFGTVTMLNAVHSSSFPDGTYGGNPAGFLITVGEKRLYYAGDTALMTDMKLFGDYYKPTLAILPIGDNFTMGAKDAALAAEMLNCKDVIGMHYDTFGYIKIDKKEAEKAFNAKDCNLILMEIGESKNF